MDRLIISRTQSPSNKLSPEADENQGGERDSEIEEGDWSFGPLTEQVNVQFAIPDICSLSGDEFTESKRTTCATEQSTFFTGPSEWFLRNTSLDEADSKRPDDASISSANSVPYFHSTDFNRSNWESVINAPTMGFAVVGLAMAITHPLLFLAGVATAVGTATAASQGYDCLVEKGLFVQIWEGVFEPNDGEEFPQSTSLEGQKLPLTNQKVKSDDTDDSTVDGSTDNNQQIVNGQDETLIEPFIPSLMQNASNKAFTPAKHNLPESWLEDHYVDLRNKVVTNREFVGLNALEFFRVFFDDDAPYNFQEFQKKRGDLNIQYGKWTDMEQKGHLSLHPPAGASNFPFDTANLLSYKTRVLEFRAKTNNSNFLGPAYATTTKTQRILVLSKRFAVLEMKTVLKDIPFADRFFVLERWVVHAEKSPEGLYTICLSVTNGVVFTGSCPFESPIRAKSAAAVSDVVNAWCKMAAQVLELTEKNKEWRLRHFNDDDDISCTDAAEEDALAPSEKPIACYRDEGDVAVEMNIDSYMDTTQGLMRTARSLTRVESAPPLKEPRRRSFLGLRRSLSHILTTSHKEPHEKRKTTGRSAC